MKNILSKGQIEKRGGIKDMKILITGGAGYLGSYVAQLLKEHCIVYDNLLYSDEYLEPVEFVYGDVTNHSLLKKYLDRVDCVIWLAAIVGDAACNIHPRKAITTNVEAVKFLAENFNGKIVCTSSCLAYGKSTEIVNEEFPLNPQSLYAETRIKSEQYFKNKNAIILRLGTLHSISKRMRF